MKRYLLTQSNGEAIEEQANDGVGSTIETIDEDTTLTAADSGKIFILSADEGADITLPAPESGFRYKFIIGAAFDTSPWTIVADDDIIEGGAIVNSTFVAAENENTIEFDESSEAVGDFVELVSDGTSWFVSGVGAGAGSIVFTAPA